MYEDSVELLEEQVKNNTRGGFSRNFKTVRLTSLFQYVRSISSLHAPQHHIMLPTTCIKAQVLLGRSFH